MTAAVVVAFVVVFGLESFVENYFHCIVLSETTREVESWQQTEMGRFGVACFVFCELYKHQETTPVTQLQAHYASYVLGEDLLSHL